MNITISEKKTHSEQISPVIVVVAMVIVIDSVIGGFSWVDFGCFICPITANCPITLSDYNSKK